MDTAMEQQKLEEMLDRAVREVTRRTAGVELFKTQEPPFGDLCTVYITFKNGFQSSLTGSDRNGGICKGIKRGHPEPGYRPGCF